MRIGTVILIALILMVALFLAGYGEIAGAIGTVLIWIIIIVLIIIAAVIVGLVILAAILS